eukprot:scaffold4344_cov207-Prasinococcus_capsulatus_cf.AAC.2
MSVYADSSPVATLAVLSCNLDLGVAMLVLARALSGTEPARAGTPFEFTLRVETLRPASAATAGFSSFECRQPIARFCLTERARSVAAQCGTDCLSGGLDTPTRLWNQPERQGTAREQRTY